MTLSPAPAKPRRRRPTWIILMVDRDTIGRIVWGLGWFVIGSSGRMIGYKTTVDPAEVERFRTRKEAEAVAAALRSHCDLTRKNVFRRPPLVIVERDGYRPEASK